MWLLPARAACSVVWCGAGSGSKPGAGAANPRCTRLLAGWECLAATAVLRHSYAYPPAYPPASLELHACTCACLRVCPPSDVPPLQPAKVAQLAEGIRSIAAQEEPVGKLLRRVEVANGRLLHPAAAAAAAAAAWAALVGQHMPAWRTGWHSLAAAHAHWPTPSLVQRGGTYWQGMSVSPLCLPMPPRATPHTWLRATHTHTQQRL